MKKRPPYNENTQIRGALRRAFARHPIVVEIRNAARREVPRYKKDGTRAKKNAVQYCCEVCSTWVSSTKISVDHKEPVISTETGFVDWNTFIARLFCSKENLQRICDECHQKKTNSERFARDFKKELETVEAMEVASSKYGPDVELIRKFTKKFTAKKLAMYPEDFQRRIAFLKALVGKQKK